ncbi:MAG: hypothetical protein HC856_09245 [Pseudanabaena sp. RU_4_16]|nr:hypothetical protein [Pseudanabaena sp. RU_4_16]
MQGAILEGAMMHDTKLHKAV